MSVSRLQVFLYEEKDPSPQDKMGATTHYWPIAVAVGAILCLAGVFLTLAAHQVLPHGINVISDLGIWGQVAGYGGLGVGFIITLIGGVKWYLKKQNTGVDTSVDKSVPEVSGTHDNTAQPEFIRPYHTDNQKVLHGELSNREINMPVFDGSLAQVQENIAELVQQGPLLFYTRPTPVQLSYWDNNQQVVVKRTVKQEKFDTRIAQINSKSKPARDTHDGMHCVRTTLWTQVLISLHQKASQLSPQIPPKQVKPMLMALAAAFHDSGREGEGEDVWHQESADLFEHFMLKLNIPSEHWTPYHNAILQKDSKESSHQSDAQEILHDADVIEIMRLTGRGDFQKDRLLFVCHFHESKEFIDVLLDEMYHFIEVTNLETVRNHFEYHGENYYRDVVQFLFYYHSQHHTFPLLTHFLRSKMALMILNLDTPLNHEVMEKVRENYNLPTPTNQQHLDRINDGLQCIHLKFSDFEKESRLNILYKHETVDNLIEEKAKLLKEMFPENPTWRILYMGRQCRDGVPPKTQLSHVSSSKDHLISILKDGIRQTLSTEIEETKWGNNELGQGLYVSARGDPLGGYALDDGLRYVLIFETVVRCETYRIPYASDILQKTPFKALSIQLKDIPKGFAEIEREFDIIQREAVFPRDGELVIRNPRQKIKPVGYIDLSVSKEICPIGDLVSETELHSQWHVLTAN
jgi:hypothetical protein